MRSRFGPLTILHVACLICALVEPWSISCASPTIANLSAHPDVNPTPLCNNLSRTLQAAAGSTETSTNCGSITFTITVGVTTISVTTPSSCPNSRTVRSDDTFSCGPAATNLNCKAQGYQVTIKQYDAGAANPCPNIPDTLPTTVAGARALTQCLTLPLTSTIHTWSATCTNCNTGSSFELHTQGEVVNTGQDVYTVNYGDPSSLLAGPQPNILLVQLEGAQTVSPETLPSALRDCYLLHTKITGVKSLVATVQYDFAATPEMSAIHNSFTINGMLSSDGRFSVSNSYSSLDSEDGTSSLATDDLAFDGASFFWGTRGSPFYNAYSSSSALAQPAMGCQARFMDPLIGWAYSPFWITLFPGTTYTSFVVQALGETSIVQVTQTDPQMPSSGTTVYTISAGAVTHPTRIDTLDHEGNLVRRRDFSGYRSLATDVWRPMVVVESLYVPGTSSPYLVKTLTITSAVVLSASEANSPFPRPQSATNQWFVRR